MVTKEHYTLSEVADLLGKSKETLRRWDNNGKLTAVREPMSNYRVYRKEQLKIFDELE
ncbi:MAG: MerR family transcriptional regulator, partial [Flammeovirgaceae bacterium]